MYETMNPTVSKHQAVLIMRGAIEECDCVAKEHPDLARSCEALKAHLSSALDQAEHEIGDDTAIKVIGKAMVSAARNFAIPVSLKSATEVNRQKHEEPKKHDPAKPDIHTGHLTAVQTSCVSLGHYILGTPMPEPAARALRPIDHLTLAESQERKSA